MQTSEHTASRYGAIVFSIVYFAVAAAVLFAYSRPLATSWVGFDKTLAYRAAALALLILSVPFIAALKFASARRINDIGMAFAVACLVGGVAFAFVSKVNHAFLAIPLVIMHGIFMAGLFFTVTIVPAALFVWFAEYVRLRSTLFYIPAGAAIVLLCLFVGRGAWQQALYWLWLGKNPDPYGLLGGVNHWLPLSDPDTLWLIAAGALGGLIYWASAGRNAGNWREES